MYVLTNVGSIHIQHERHEKYKYHQVFIEDAQNHLFLLFRPYKIVIIGVMRCFVFYRFVFVGLYGLIESF